MVAQRLYEKKILPITTDMTTKAIQRRISLLSRHGMKLESAGLLFNVEKNRPFQLKRKAK
jgi:hypothetical protein